MRHVMLTLTLIGVLSIVLTVMAEVPPVINYQGRLNNNMGEPLDTIVNMTFSIYNDSAGSQILWSESQSSIIVENGLFNVLLGSVNNIPNSAFETDAYLGIAVGDNDEITPKTKFSSVAYAYRTYEADKLDGYDAFDLLNWPGEPSNVFRCTGATNGTGSYVDICPAVGNIRQITGIIASGDAGVWAAVWIGGGTAFNFRLSSENPNFVWSSGIAAGMLVQSSETVGLYINGGGQCEITITGYEY